MRNTKIEWCDMTWNPVTGCLHGCQYCYARRIADRFASKDPDAVIETANCKSIHVVPELNRYKGKVEPYPFGFQPTFHSYRLEEPARTKKPQVIFVCSMADLFGEWVPDEWIRQVFEACDRAPWHTYLFLTKNPKRYIELAKKDLLPRQHWYGYSATRQNQLWEFQHLSECLCPHLFVSIEPMLEPMNPLFLPFATPLDTRLPADWVILGAETGNRKNKVIPEKRWIEDIVETCELCSIPVFMKDSLLPIMGEAGIKRRFPLEMCMNKFQHLASKFTVSTARAGRAIYNLGKCLAKESGHCDLEECEE